MSKQQSSLRRARQRPARCEACRAVPVAIQDSESPCWTHESVALFRRTLSSCLKISLLWSNRRERVAVSVSLHVILCCLVPLSLGQEGRVGGLW